MKGPNIGPVAAIVLNWNPKRTDFSVGKNSTPSIYIFAGVVFFGSACMTFLSNHLA